MKKTLFSVLFLLVFTASFAQKLKVTAQLIVPPPYSPRIADLVDSPARQNSMLILTNTGEAPNTPVKIVGEIKSRSTGARVFTKPSYRPDQPILLNSVGQPLQIMFALENRGFLDARNVEYVGLPNDILNQVKLSGLVPAGFYDFCVYVVPYDAVVENFQNLAGQCLSIPLTMLEPPRLTTPICDAKVQLKDNVPNQTMFSWTPPVGNIGGYQIKYDLFIVKVPNGQNPNDAINNAVELNVGNPFVERDLSAPNYMYGQAEPELSVGKYAWKVVAKDPNEVAVFQNKGQSQYCVFEVLPAVAPPPPPRQNTMPLLGASSCKGTALPNDQNQYFPEGNLAGLQLNMGKFKLTIDEAQKAGDVYKGNGRVSWNSVPIKVVFENLKFNANLDVYSGDAQADNTDYDFPNPKDITKLDTWKTLSKGGQGFDLGSYAAAIENNALDKAKALMSVKLPVGVKTGAGFIGVNYMRFSPEGSDMGALFNMPMPEANQYLAMAAVDVCMVPDKVFAGDAHLILLDDLKVPGMPFNFIQGKFPKPDDTGTYVFIKNDDIDHIHAVMDLNFGSEVLKLDDGNGKIIPGDVKARMVFDFLHWNDWVGTAKVPAFTVDGLKEFTINGLDAFYDHSDKRNPEGFHVPDEYKGDKGLTFRGLYMKKTEIKLPTKFKGANDQRLGFQVSDLIVDDNNEFTAIIDPTSKPILDYSTGKLGDWGFSIDDFKIKIIQNRFELGMMKGKLQFPISADHLDYSCNLRSNLDSMEFVIEFKENYNIPIMIAKMKIDKNSSFRLAINGNDKKINLDLSGSVGIGIGQNSIIKIPLVNFEHFRVSNNKKDPEMKGEQEIWVDEGIWVLAGGLWDNKEKPGAGKGPYLNEEYSTAFAAEEKSGLAGFPIELTPPKFIFRGLGAIGFGFGVKVNVGGGDKTIIGAETTVEILGKVGYVNGRITPAFDKVALTEIMIKGDVGPAKVEGRLRLFDDDPVYGTGFLGQAKVKIPKLATVRATLQFGYKDFYYGYIDASVLLTPGIVVVPPLMCSGFGGGIYFNMKMNNPVPDVVKNVAPNEVTTKAGTSNSGINYVPELGAFGFKAKVYASLAEKTLILASFGIEAGFDSGGLRNIIAQGKAKVLSIDEDPEKNGQCLLTAQTTITITPSSFDMSADVEASLLFVKVVVPFRMHFADTWHVKIGDPADGAPKVEAQLIKIGSPDDMLYVYLGVKAYIAFGNDLAGMPALPREVRDFLLNGKGVPDGRNNEIDKASSKSNNVSYDEDGLPTGKPSFAVLLGARVDGRLSVSIGPLSANIVIIAGFDAALQKDLKCQGNANVAGLYGWYANAQIYAYAHGDVSVSGKVFGKRFKVKLVSVTAGALLQGGLPNPTWGEGNFRVKGEVLGGLVEVDEDFNFDFGEKCKAVFGGDPLRDIKVISSLSPSKGSTDIATDTEFQATFNMGLDRDYQITLPDGQVRTYYFKIETYSVKKQNDGTPYASIGAKQLINDNEQMLVSNNGHLKSVIKYDFLVTVKLLERVGGQLLNPFIDETNQRELRVETETNTFTSGKQPDFIRLKDLEYTWPIDGQNYFLKNQLSMGIISGNIPDEAIRGINTNDASETTKRLNSKIASFMAYFVPEAGGDTLKTELIYTKPTAYSKGKLMMNLPPNLQNSAVYRMEFHRFKMRILGGRFAEGFNTNTLIARGSDKIDGNAKAAYSVKNNTSKLQDNKAQEYDKIIYSLAFKTSKYNTFEEKMANTSFEQSKYESETTPNASDFLYIKANPVAGAENFEDDEMNTHKFSSSGALQPPLLNVQPLVFDSTTDFDKKIASDLYSPLDNACYKNQIFKQQNYQDLRSHYGTAAPSKAIKIGRKVTIGGLVYKPFVLGNIIGNQASNVDNTVGSSSGGASSLFMSGAGNLAAASVNSFVYLFNLYSFQINDAPSKPYQFTFMTDHIAYHDFMAFRGLGAEVINAKNSYGWTLNNNYYKNFVNSHTVSFSSKSISLISPFSKVMQTAAIFEAFGGPNNPNYYRFPKRANGTMISLNITYTPFPGAPYGYAAKQIQVGSTPFQIIYAPVLYFPNAKFK